MQTTNLDAVRTTSSLARLERLVRVYKRGQNSELMDRVLDKVFAQEVADTRAAIKRLETDIQHYEAQYGMAANDFYRQFQAGELGDSMDFIEWSSLILMRTHLEERLEVLTG